MLNCVKKISGPQTMLVKFLLYNLLHPGCLKCNLENFQKLEMTSETSTVVKSVQKHNTVD